jgi:hypothetical protein
MRARRAVHRLAKFLRHANRASLRVVNRARRRIVFAGALGAVAFAAVRLLPSNRPRQGPGGLTPDGVDVMRALLPALLVGALPQDVAMRTKAIDETLEGIGYAITGLTPIAREELGSLFALLAFAPLRIGVAGVRVPWADVTLATADTFLTNLRGSRWPQKRAAYDALHQLTFAAWYADPRSWPAIGYPGPTPLT